MATETSRHTERVRRSRAMVEDGPTDFRVSPQVYTDPQVFDDEMRAIFESTWIYVAHESQVAQVGDYVTTYMGRQPVIVSRGEDGAVHILLNACRHRGNTLCREEQGNAAYYRCAYHGWVYKSSGELVGISERRQFPDDFDEDITGLLPVPRVQLYRGLIFASLNPNVPSLEEHLGPTRKYLDLWGDLSPTGKIRLLAPHKLLCSSNWKFHVENTTEGYHARFVHESAFNTIKWSWGDKAATQDYVVGQEGRAVGLPHGHQVMERPGMTTLSPPLRAQYQALLEEAYGPERTAQILYGRNMTIFPNLALLDNDLRVIYPVSVERTEVYHHSFRMEGVPDEINRDNLRDSQYRRGTMGYITPDDLEMFVSNQAGTHAEGMAWLHMSKGLGTERELPEGEQEGAHIHDEITLRTLYREWLRLMTADEP